MAFDQNDPAVLKALKAMEVGRIYFQQHLKDAPAQDYLGTRDLSVGTCRIFELGFAPAAWRGLVDHYTHQTVRAAAVDAGLLHRADSGMLNDFFRGRLMFPVRNTAGQLVGYGGRVLDQATGSGPKYINTPETVLFDKSALLYGAYQNQGEIRRSGEALIVEGYMDVIRLASAGLQLGLAPMGTALTNQQLELAKELGAKRVWLCFDGDKAGTRAAVRALQIVMDKQDSELEVRVMQLPPGEDPDSYVRQHGPESFRAEMNRAHDLATFIHQVCMTGLADKPGIEDRALYLHKLEEYTSKAQPTLLLKLLSKASTFSGLPIASMNLTDATRAKLAAISEWDPLVAHAARWMAHSPNAVQIAQRFATLRLESAGLGELRTMAGALADQRRSDTMLEAFARASGPLLKREMADLQSRWTTWLQEKHAEARLSIGHLQRTITGVSASETVSAKQRPGLSAP